MLIEGMTPYGGVLSIELPSNNAQSANAFYSATQSSEQSLFLNFELNENSISPDLSIAMGSSVVKAIPRFHEGDYPKPPR